MPASDECMFQNLIPVLLRELGCDRAEMKAERFRITAAAKDGFLAGLYSRIRRIVTPSLSSLFLEHLEQCGLLDCYLEDRSSSQLDGCRREFCAAVSASGCAVLDQKVPGLTNRIINTYHQYCFVSGEMLERLDRSFDNVCRTVLHGKPFHELTSVSADLGDLHNGGHSACVLVTDAGTIVYKPHDVGIDAAVGTLIRTYFDDVMEAPAVFRGDGFGFAEFIQNEPASNAQDAERYFHNLGGLAAVVQMLGSSDLHHNNVISRGVYPVIIDYEVMLRPGSQKPGKGPADDLNYSLLHSSLMPARKHDAELSILFAKDEKNAGAPVTGGVRKNIEDYPEAFFSGFEAIYRRCMKLRNELRSMILSMDHLFVRHIYRATGAYTELLNKTLEPGWIKDPGLKDELFRQLSAAMKRSGARDADEIAQAETESLLAGDIPYLYTRTDTCDLYAGNKVVYKDFFRVSCLDNACFRLDHLSEEDLAFETALLKKAMTRVIRRSAEPEHPRPAVCSRKTIDDNALMHEAERIFALVQADALSTPSGGLCWFGPDYFLETGMHLYGTGLGEGTTGIAVFTAALSSLTEDPAIRECSLSLTDRIMKRTERTVRALQNTEVIYPNVENISLMSGLAGLLAVLCAFDEFFTAQGIPEFCGTLSDRLLAMASISYRGKRIWRTLSPAWAISGAGHGQSGIAAALAAAGRRLGRQDLLEAADAGFAFEADIYSPELHAWPDRRRSENSTNYMTGYCSGAPGIGMNALSARCPGFETVLDLAVDSTVREPLQYKDFLCCGNCASIEFLLSAGESLNRPELLSEARSRMAMIIERAQKSGHNNCVNERVQDVFSPGLFYGVSGIGYEILRLIAPEKTEPVLL